MEIIYIGHSGFWVELSECCLLFDYYEGELPEQKSDKPLILFSSHSHHDHFNPEVFERILGDTKMYGVFSKDIFKSRVPQQIESQFAGPEETILLPFGITVETLRSTDKGVAFLVMTKEGCLYHGGDLNDWIWKGEPEAVNRSMTGSYRKEIKKLADKKIDVAFVPLDPRQEEYYDRGMVYFLEQTRADRVIPMHFWKKTQTIDRFLEEHPEYRERVSALKKPMERIII